MAKTWSTRPSDLLDIQDPHEAFRLDRAVWSFGTALTAELNNAKGKTESAIKQAQERILKKWIPESTTPGTEKFADPPTEGRL